MQLIYCPQCGLLLPAGAHTCPRCGRPAPVQPPPPPPRYQPPRTAPAPGPRYHTPPHAARPTLGGYLGALLLFSIPGVGLIVLLAWACGGTDRPDRQKLAQAFLLWLAILSAVVLALAIAFAAQPLLPLFAPLLHRLRPLALARLLL